MRIRNTAYLLLPAALALLLLVGCSAENGLTGLGLGAGGGNRGPVHQPIRFNHAIHVKQGLKCEDCHRGVETSPHATFPTIQQCMLCHNTPKGTDPEEPKVREYAQQYAKDGSGIPWVQVNRLPGYVYYSHAMHVKLGKLDCKTCHGDMSMVTEPVTTPQIDNLTMARCMACHTEHHVDQECVTCHK
ncbi:MAG: cytochrome c3 family protein [Planctomycetota bacterium]